MALTRHCDVRQVGETLVAEVSFTAAEEDLRALLGGHTLLPERETGNDLTHGNTLAPTPRTSSTPRIRLDV